ncbi:MAG: nucleotidyltransferase domain-containing protein [Campylobacterales bacterium]|nr:nucleotidyltransferase domain-containing protein [Campylobacterales bacterium]
MNQSIENNLKSILNEIKPYKAVVFGSHASQSATATSDLDLMIVTNEEKLPQSFDEKNKNYLDVNYHLRTLYKKIPIDLIVYTKEEYRQLKELKSNFISEIDKNGVTIYG